MFSLNPRNNPVSHTLAPFDTGDTEKKLAKDCSCERQCWALNRSSLAPELSFLRSGLQGARWGRVGSEPIKAPAYISEVRASQGQGFRDNSS